MIATCLLAAALVLFLLAFAGLATGRFNLVAAGLALLTIYELLHRSHG